MNPAIMGDALNLEFSIAASGRQFTVAALGACPDLIGEGRVGEPSGLPWERGALPYKDLAVPSCVRTSSDRRYRRAN